MKGNSEGAIRGATRGLILRFFNRLFWLLCGEQTKERGERKRRSASPAIKRHLPKVEFKCLESMDFYLACSLLQNHYQEQCLAHVGVLDIFSD